MNHLELHVGIGSLRFCWNEQGLLNEIRWSPSSEQRPVLICHGSIPLGLVQLLDQFRDYFELGRPIKRVPWEVLDLSDWSDFQRRVYECAALIPHGETRSYAWIAQRMGTRATRAVGQALRKNPLLLLVPCHRVVSSQGGLGGFMGCADPNEPEVRLKKKLIEIEDGYRNPTFSFLAAVESRRLPSGIIA